MGEEEVEKEEFEETLRFWVISLLLFLVLSLISYSVLKKYQEQNEDKVTFALCVGTFSVCLVSALLIPLTMIAFQIWQISSSSPVDYKLILTEYASWLTPKLIFALWNSIFILSLVCLLSFTSLSDL